MTILSSSTLVNTTLVQMLPSHPQLTGKRKPEDSNPLLNVAAAKRAKKEAKLGASAKRKAPNDEGAGGLLIVRAPDPQPPQSQPVASNPFDFPPPRFASQPLHAESAGPSKPPSKKFKADAQPSARPRASSKAKPAPRDRVAHPAAFDDSEVENDVRAMEDEADRLRRNSRAHTTINSSLLAREAGVHFPPRAEPVATARSKGKAKATEMIVPLPENETPQIERNKQLRQGAMDAITGSRGRAMETNGADSSRGHRRKSSVSGRGKRQSTSFEATGVITQPHNSVSESSFYKHIDCDLPEPERVRQLLIWCSLRAAATPPTPNPTKAASSSSTSLPPLSPEGAQVLKKVQDSLVRMLAEKRMNFNLYSEGSSSKKSPEELRENEQNVRNRQWEVTYTQHIQQLQAEEESWKKVSYGYDAYAKKLQSSLEKRAAALQLDSQTLSAKARGKRRATGETDDYESHFFPQEHEIPPDFHSALHLAKSVLGQRPTIDDPLPASARYGTSRSNLSREEVESELKRRLPLLEYKLDQIYSWASTARATTNIAEMALNERFDVLTANLASRNNPFPPAGDAAAGPGAGAGAATQLMKTYVVPPGARPAGADPLDLLRALSRVDQERPAALVGDAARRAAREVQRAGENGLGAVGERGLTGVPATPSRKAPGTPRRGTTPSRDR